MQYRVSFYMQIAGAFLITFLDFVAILVIFNRIPALAGWDVHEVAFLYGTSYVMFKTADMFMGNLDKLRVLIPMGTFDQVLTRPLGTLGQVLTADLDLRHIGGISQGAIVLIYGLSGTSIDWTIARAIVLATMMVSGLVIFCGIWVTTNSIAFWTTDAREVANAFTYGGNFFTQHPLNIFAKWMQRVLGYGFVLGFVNYFPSLYLLGKDDQTGAPFVLRFLSPLAAVAAAIVASVVWRTAVRHYRSTGS